jgi:hypothetical protein
MTSLGSAAPAIRELVGRHVAIAGFAALAVVAAAARVANFPAPLVGDAAQFLYVGETVAHGGTPYVDAAYSKGPLTALLFALIDPVAGASSTVVRLTVVPFAAAAGLALAGYVAHYAGRAVGALAGLTYAAFSAAQILEGAEAKTEQYGVAPVFGALWVATRRGIRGAAAAGALVACAMLINPALGIAIPVVALELWLGAPASERARRFGAAVAGAAVPALLACAWLGLAGALDDAVAQIGGQISDSLRPGHRVAVLDVTSDRLSVPMPELWILATVGCVLALRERRLRRPVLALALVMGAVLVRVKIASYEFNYQYYAALPAMCGAMALGAGSLWPGRRAARATEVAVVLAVPLWARVVHPQLDLLGKDPAARDPYGAAVYPVAAFLRSHTRSTDRIIVEGGRAEVYWVAQRRAPTRFFDVFGLNGDDAYPAERRRDLARHPPAAVVVMNTDRLSPDLRKLVVSRRYFQAYARRGSFVWVRPGRRPDPRSLDPNLWDPPALGTGGQRQEGGPNHAVADPGNHPARDRDRRRRDRPSGAVRAGDRGAVHVLQALREGLIARKVA